MSMTRHVVEDVETLKAVTHPLRLRLLGLLRADGPATATELARLLGESSGSTSYHLRQLERYGFITDATEQRSGRERRWQAAHDMTSFPDSLAALPGGRAALEQINQFQLDQLTVGLQAWRELDDPTGFGHSDYKLDLDPNDLRELSEEITALIDRYRERAGSEPVRLHVLALPRSTTP